MILFYVVHQILIYIYDDFNHTIYSHRFIMICVAPYTHIYVVYHNIHFMIIVDTIYIYHMTCCKYIFCIYIQNTFCLCTKFTPPPI